MMDKLVLYGIGISLKDNNGKEIISWDEEEWIDDPSVVYAIVSAISILVEKGPEALRKRIVDNEGI